MFITALPTGAMQGNCSIGDLPSSALTLTSISNVYCEIGRQAESLRSLELASQYFLEMGDFRNAAVMLVRYRAALKRRGMEPPPVENSGAGLKNFSRVDDPAADFFSRQIPRHRPTPSIEGESEPLPIAAKPAKDLDLASFTFETITLNDLGKVKKCRKITARHFIQELAPGISLEMVEIPGETFTMGAPKNEECSLNCERPQHEISLSPFYIGKFTITQTQWRVVASGSKVWRRLNPAPSRFKGEDRPVERVSWFDAKARKHEPRNQTIPVGSLGKANAFGLFDMHGNTREWCRDWYGDYPAAPQTNPRGPAKGTCRVVRGGSWYANAYNCRSAARIGLTPELRNDTVSFRVAFSYASHSQSSDCFAG
jgi:formylglycine-generating enzyme required for sulfatase activity